MAIHCGHCGGRHATVGEVRACSVPVPRPPDSPRVDPASHTPILNAPSRVDGPGQPSAGGHFDQSIDKRRAEHLSDVLTLVASYSPHVDEHQLRSWARSPAAHAFVGFRVSLLRKLAEQIREANEAVTPEALAAKAHGVEQSAGRDANIMLEGRDARLTDSHRPPADGELHRRIGRVDVDD